MEHFKDLIRHSAGFEPFQIFNGVFRAGDQDGSGGAERFGESENSRQTFSSLSAHQNRQVADVGI